MKASEPTYWSGAPRALAIATYCQAISGEPDGQSEKGYLVQASPKEFAGWAFVAAYYTQQTGVCEVRAIKEVSGDAFGIAHRMAADSLVETLTKKYGAFDKDDFLLSGSVWDEPNEWLIGIRKKERMYGYSKKGDIEGNLQSIIVRVGEPGIVLGYAFKNGDACEEAVSKAALSDL